ncbi:MAG: hypothetical protein MJZ38_02120 [archaeon]|nr:hypothetical protein [archaeon]
MTDNKFEKKVEKASEDKLSRMYLKRLDRSPSPREVEELRTLSQMIPENVKDDLQFTYYERAVRKLNDERFMLLTGYGQCRGMLVVHNNDVVVCCCREMAALVAYHGARYSRGCIHLPGESGNACRHEGSVFLIPEDVETTVTYCPYCNASINERIDFFRTSEENDEGE